MMLYAPALFMGPVRIYFRAFFPINTVEPTQGGRLEAGLNTA